MTKTCPYCQKDGLNNLGLHMAQTSCEYPELSDKQKDVLIGILMGDGSIRDSGLFEVSVKSREYLEYVNSLLPDWLVTKSGVHRVGGSGLYRLRTVSHPFTQRMRARWYPKGEKKYPLHTININATVLQHWYCTDGGLDGHGRPCLYSSNEDTTELRDWLQEEGFDVCRDSKTVRFNKDGAQLLYEMVESCPGYEYKLAGLDDV